MLAICNPGSSGVRVLFDPDEPGLGQDSAELRTITVHLTPDRDALVRMDIERAGHTTFYHPQIDRMVILGRQQLVTSFVGKGASWTVDDTGSW